MAISNYFRGIIFKFWHPWDTFYMTTFFQKSGSLENQTPNVYFMVAPIFWGWALEFKGGKNVRLRLRPTDSWGTSDADTHAEDGRRGENSTGAVTCGLFSRTHLRTCSWNTCEVLKQIPVMSLHTMPLTLYSHRVLVASGSHSAFLHKRTRSPSPNSILHRKRPFNNEQPSVPQSTGKTW